MTELNREIKFLVPENIVEVACQRTPGSFPGSCVTIEMRTNENHKLGFCESVLNPLRDRCCHLGLLEHVQNHVESTHRPQVGPEVPEKIKKRFVWSGI